MSTFLQIAVKPHIGRLYVFLYCQAVCVTIDGVWIDEWIY
jgi:hypothetical protein